ncbi:MAG: VWA domain-containing protein [Eubacteriales bacterium]|nr:VWA domain-containing protein [Sarcina sp.]MBR2729349.1 VWA domain-containing protein [Lachnospiraceae bacterium]MDO4418599.1 VWA domain-containing protein [Eubacteriales bacterium]
MFLGFFYYLREQGLKISIGDWMVLLEGMEKGLHESTVEGFYFLCRAVLLRDESEFDLFDQAFSAYFGRVLEGGSLPQDLQALLEKIDPSLPENAKQQDAGRSDAMLAMDGIPGTPGSGKNAPGPGSGSTGGRTAIFAPGSRKFRDFRKDNTLDTRQFQMAFRVLRNLSAQLETSEQEFDIDRTIDGTCRRGGMLDIQYRKPRKNTIRVILLMDSGGSMRYFSRLCSELFQAATASRHLRELRTYYFHNIVYSLLYKDPTIEIRDDNCISVDGLMTECDEKYRVIFVGDAEMHPYELEGTEYNFVDKKPGLPGSETLRLLKRHFPHMIWLNPIPLHEEGYDPEGTRRTIASIVDMYDLTLDGLERGFRFLLSGKK